MQIEDRKIFFLNSEGKEVYIEDCINHEELAKCILKNDEKLKEKFEKSGMKLEIAFLLKEGYIYGTESERYKEVVCLARNISKRGRELIQYYREEGYSAYDIEKIYGEEALKEFFGEEKQEQKEQEEQEI